MREYYEAYNDRYRQVHSQKLRWFSRKHSPIVQQVLEEFSISPENRVLEIGCGEGRDAFFLLQRGYDLLATDIAPEAIAFCKSEYAAYSGRFQQLNCVKDTLERKFDFIYAVAVIHMLVRDEDRQRFYRFVHRHLNADGMALICSMGDGRGECCSDISTAFALQDRQHEESGKWLRIAATSYRAVSFPAFERELKENGLSVVKKGITLVEPDYGSMMYAVVRRC